MEPYAGFSRFTDPGSHRPLLEALPADPIALCEVAERQTIHHNLMGYFGIEPDDARTMRRVWPPRASDVLDALIAHPPRNLTDDRRPQHRIVGACMLEAHFLASLLRSKGIPTRIRAGYFQRIRANREHIVQFWRGALHARGVDDGLLRADPDRWRANLDAFSSHLNRVDHHIEHWACEYRDDATGSWRLLDANRSFLKAHSDLDVGFHLPAEHFEHAWQAWQAMRSSDAYDPDRHAEETQDGRSHIRSQLLSDFFSQLNHDLAGVDEPDAETTTFVRTQTYGATSEAERSDLDELAAIMSADPTAAELREFYLAHGRLHVRAAEGDPRSFVFAG